jgi:hypothetical protein
MARKKRRKVLTKSEAQKRRAFERREVVISPIDLVLFTKGYEAYRVSPQTTVKHGKKYKKIYGATVEPDHKRKAKGKHTYGAKVNWYSHGYTSASTKSGTRIIANLRGYPVDVKEARRKLMMKRRKPKKRRK